MQRLFSFRWKAAFVARALIVAILAVLGVGYSLSLLITRGAPALAASESTMRTTARLPPRPNIIVIMTDDMDTASLETMPRTRALVADEGITFLESYVNFSLCCPSRSSFLTGMAAHNHGVLSNSVTDSPGGYSTFLANGYEDKNIGTWFQKAGYKTGLIGKVLNGYGNEDIGNPARHVMPGWDTWNALPTSYGVQDYFDYGININGVIEKYGHAEQDYKTDVLSRKAVAFVNRRAQGVQPFFLLLTPNAPHDSGADIGHLGPYPAPRDVGAFSNVPLPRPPNFNEKRVSDKPGWVRALPRLDAAAVGDLTTIFRRRREALLAVDDMVEKVVHALKSNGILSNTYVIFTSDNGYSMGEHRWGDAKRVVYEESVHVPLLIRGPGIPNAQVRHQLVNNLDVVTTIVDWAGVTPETVLDGHSLQPIILDRNGSWRTAMLIEGSDGDFNHTVPPYARFVAVRTQDEADPAKSYVYVEHESSIFGSEQELYHLSSDPFELHNLAGKSGYQGVVSVLHQVLTKLATCAGGTCWFDDPLTFSPQSSGLAPGKSPVFVGKVQPSYSSGQEMIRANGGDD